MQVAAPASQPLQERPLRHRVDRSKEAPLAGTIARRALEQPICSERRQQRIVRWRLRFLLPQLDLLSHCRLLAPSFLLLLLLPFPLAKLLLPLMLAKLMLPFMLDALLLPFMLDALMLPPVLATRTPQRLLPALLPPLFEEAPFAHALRRAAGLHRRQGDDHHDSLAARVSLVAVCSLTDP